MPISNHRYVFEASVAEQRFNMARLEAVLRSDGSLECCDAPLRRRMPALASSVARGLIRAAFLIEPVNRDITSTKFAVRWGEDPGRGDPRFASFEDCVSVWERLVGGLSHQVEDPCSAQHLALMATEALLPYELPVDYAARRTDRIHCASNARWLDDGRLLDRVLGLRRLLRPDSAGEHRSVFIAAYEKIRVKTYLTDRVLTGPHKTNREKRWEVHPESVHFALRVDCLAVECQLVDQLLHFDGFPTAVRRAAVDAGLVEEGSVARCPVTLAPLDFDEFARDVVAPSHGRSAFQVGHLNPLKSEVPAGEQEGHVPGNVAWISAAGNRMQGDLSLEEVRTLIREIAGRYGLEGLL